MTLWLTTVGITSRVKRSPVILKARPRPGTRESPVTKAAEPRQPQNEVSAVTHRVLIAEDEALIRLDLAEMLREEGYDVVAEAADGESAVELARDLRPSLVIMDIKMPKVDGISAAATIVGERIAPVVMLTAFSQRDLIEQARDAGAMAYLVKPFARHELVPAIELSVSRFAEMQALENEVATLNDRLETRKAIDRAKGLLMTNNAMSEPEAFRWIQRTAMDRRSTMRAVADAIISGLATPTATS